ncbi:plant SNARE 13-like isoform X1 [Tripterygium wilfordii]|uniref:Plant SNARE 13-like isoform X1 n=1 Tax=Tripterygium wilfordii TaxID=458696 RepID=A0A7J7CT01_TRIWF|nr:plant SNARE 13-like isoform X1 [Tripterygium wilfordii]
MAAELLMTPQLEQIHGEIRDSFGALASGFQRLDKIKDSNRQSKQLEELTGKMRECKRLIKEFDREIKEEESRNPPELNKQLNDEKQSMVSHFESYTFPHATSKSLTPVALRKTYMNTIGNKKLELFDMGAGIGEPTAEENIQVASAMSNQELINAGMKTMDETDQAIQRSKMVVEQTIEVGTQTATTSKGQTEQMGRIVNELDTIQFSIKKASQLVKEIGRKKIQSSPLDLGIALQNTLHIGVCDHLGWKTASGSKRERMQRPPQKLQVTSSMLKTVMVKVRVYTRVRKWLSVYARGN